MATDPAKIEAVQHWPVPSSPKELKRFLGLCSYYRKFVPKFAEIAHPLHELTSVTQSGQKFTWTPKANSAFQILEGKLTKTPILGYPNERENFIVDTDASNVGLGAVLSQVQDGHERVISFYSRALGQSEQHYCATRKELLAVVQAIKHYSPYLYGHQFKIRTNHSSLRWLLNSKHPEEQQARWMEFLQTYNFSIEHRPSKSHRNADTLPRRPCAPSSSYCARQEDKENQTLPEEVESVRSLHIGNTTGTEGMHATNLWQEEEILRAQRNDCHIGPIYC